MRVIYMGSPEFSVYGLDALTESSHEVVAVVSRVDKVKGRKKQLQPTALKKRALELALPVYTPENVNDAAFLEELKALNADVIVVSAFGRILKKELLELLPYGVLNIHGSLLPAYRGASPMNAVLHNGETETGITIMYMSEGMDEGDIMKMESLSIDENENFDSLRERMGLLGGRMIVECLDLLEAGRAPRVPQDHQKATYCQLLTREDERIHWEDDGRAIHNQIRSLSSEPGAYTFLSGAPFKLIRTVFEPGASGEEPGTVLRAEKKKGVAVAVRGGILYLVSVKPQGKKEMNANDWYRGLREKEVLKFSTEQ
ncbi:MAG: methionyl-tRNA formyltransferase [Clostridia bacterium]